jgi:hypothetical protein
VQRWREKGKEEIAPFMLTEERHAQQTTWEGTRGHVTDRIGNIAAQTPTIQTFAYPNAV